MRNWLRRWVFRNEERVVHDRLAAADAREQEASKLANSIGVTDLVREQLRGFNPRLLDVEDDILELVGDEESATHFLEEAHKLAQNEALPRILDFLVRNQVQESVKSAATLEAMNFGRASVNGVTLVREEVERLEAVYQERHAPDEDFDKHEAL